MANFPPSDLLQWITRVHDAPRIFQICRTTFDRRFLPRAHHPISLRLMHHVYHCILSTRFIWSLRQWLFCSWYLSWSNLEESIDKIPINHSNLHEENLFYSESEDAMGFLVVWKSIPRQEVTIEVRLRPYRGREGRRKDETRSRLFRERFDVSTEEGWTFLGGEHSTVR